MRGRKGGSWYTGTGNNLAPVHSTGIKFAQYTVQEIRSQLPILPLILSPCSSSTKVSSINLHHLHDLEKWMILDTL